MSTPQKILVLGGMHGNEALGIELVELLKARPIARVDAMIANPVAVGLGTRFSQSDLNRSFGNKFKGTYEWQRARQVRQVCRAYDIVLDLHNTQTANNNCSFVGENSDSKLLAVSQQLGLLRCIKASYDCVNKYCPNVLSIEISQGDTKDSPQYWYQQIKDLQSRNLKPTAKRLSSYRFVDRVTWQQAKANDFSNWQPFEPLTTSEKRQFRLKGTIVPIFIGSTLTEYYATLLRKEKK